VLILPSPASSIASAQLAELAIHYKLPTMHGLRSSVEAGGLISYAPDFDDLVRRAATYVDRILKGARPADIPVEQPTKFELIVNLKAAKVLGLTVPRSILVRADQIIQ
jgi:putative tryptophan/tyrosine transport system substrate-binding protein